MADKLTISRVHEYELTVSMAEQIRGLLEVCFPHSYQERHYFKQLAHFRFLAKADDVIVGHLGVDCRMINVGGEVLKIFGVLDVCVLPSWQRQGIASKLLGAVSELAVQSGQAFLVLMGELYEFYESNGYERVMPAPAKWFGIDEHKSLKLIEEDLSECFMIKPIGDAKWPSGEIDMMGYLF